MLLRTALGESLSERERALWQLLEPPKPARGNARCSRCRNRYERGRVDRSSLCPTCCGVRRECPCV